MNIYNRKQIVTLVGGAVVIATLLTLSLVRLFLQPPEQGGGIAEVSQRLNLTANQRQAVESMRQEYAAQGSALSNQLANLEQDFARAYTANPNDPDLRPLHEKVEAERQKLRQLKFEGLLRMGSILNQEQREQLMATSAKQGRPRE